MNQNAIEDQIITIISEVNEIFAKTEIRQKYKNIKNSSIEIKIKFPILPYYTLTKFTVILDKKIIVSKILEAEQGKEKYNDEISSGNTAYYGSIFESGDKLEINIGNLLPNKTIEVKTEYLQIINSEDMSYCFSLIQSYPTMILYDSGDYNIIMKGIKCNIYLTTQSSLTRFILLNKRKDIKYSTDFSQSLTYVKIYFEKINDNNTSFKSLPYSTLKILFRTENMHIPTLYSQYNEEKNETSYLIRYMYSGIDIPSKLSEKINSGDINDLQDFYAENYIDMDQTVSYYDKYGIIKYNEQAYPNCYIFIVDQSFSMFGREIETLKQALILFVKSLPLGSYFQIIGFGTNTLKYIEEPILCNGKNIQKIFEIISNLKANLGRTNLLGTLKEVFEQKKVKNMQNNIIIITDGKVDHGGKCNNCIRQNTDYFKVHCLGIGENYNKYFIEEAAKIGGGLNFFIENVDWIFYPVFKILNIYSQKYLYNINIDILNNKEYFNKRQYNNFLNSYYIAQNDIVSYGFICPGKVYSFKDNSVIKIKINFNNDIISDKEGDIKEIEALNNGEELGKIIIGSLINNRSLNKSLDKTDVINLSKKYQILSKYTCFFGSFENNEKNQDKLIKIYQFNLPDDPRANVQYSYPKTGKHGHAKKVKLVLNQEEVKNSELIEKNCDNSDNDLFSLKNEDFSLIKKIIKEQNIEDGSWENKYFQNETYNEIYNKICDYFNKQNVEKADLLKKITCTYFIIYILKENYSKYLIIWNQIVKRGLYFLEDNKVEYNKIKDIIFNISIITK